MQGERRAQAFESVFLPTVMLRMEDLDRLIWTRERALYFCRDWSNVGREVGGSIREKN